MCFGPESLFQLAILIVIIIAAIALIRLVLPTLSVPAPFGQVINILAWAVICIMAIIFIWKLAACSGLLRF